MSQIKILQITDSKHLGGGSQQRIRILCKGLNKRKFHSIIVCRPGPLVKFYQKQGFKTIPLELRHHYRSVFELIGIIKKNNISIVHTHNLLADKVGCMAAKLAGVPVIISTLHKLVNISSSGKRKYNFPIWLHNYIVKYLTDRIITVSDAVRSTAIKELKVKPSQVITIHNATDLNKFQKDIPQDKILSLKKELNITPDSIIVTVIGRLTTGKGLEDFLGCIPNVINKTKEVIFLIVGQGRQKPRFIKLAKTLGIEKNIVFTGYRSDIERILKLSDIVVVPSLAEGLSRVILEAMASEKAVIATDVGGNSEAVVHNKTGMLVPPKNPNALSESLLMLISDRDKMKQMGKAGFLRVKEKFNVPHFIEETEKVFEECLSLKSPK